MKYIKYILLLILLPVVSMFAQKYVVAGYYPDWIYDELPAESILYSHITHVIHFSVWPDSQGNVIYENWFPYPELITNTHQNNRKVLLAVGGHNRSDHFVKVAASSTLRRKFLDSLVIFVENNNYDGVDWDWEFPSDSYEGELYLNLLKELRERFDKINRPMIITLATSSGSWIGQHFDYQKMSQYLNWFYLMAYDYHGAWLDHTGHNAPLYSPSSDLEGSVHESVVYLSETRGISKDKIVLGVPFYGRIFSSEGLYKPFTDVENINYTQVDSLRKDGWPYKLDSYSKVPYLQDSGKTKFVTYEDPTSISFKTGYVKSKNLAGVMAWSMGQDLVDGNQILLEKIGNDLNLPTSVRKLPEISSSEFILYDNYPNPFNPVTMIEYLIPTTHRKIVHVKLIVYDLLGQEITRLVDKYQKPGHYKVEFEAYGLASGNYIYELRAGTFVARKPMMLVK